MRAFKNARQRAPFSQRAKIGVSNSRKFGKKNQKRLSQKPVPRISESVIWTVFFESQLANFRDLEPFPPQAAQLVAFSRLLRVARRFGCGCARRGALASALFGFRLAKVRDLRGFRPVFLHRRWDFCQLLAPARPRGRNGSRQRTQSHFPTFRCFRKVNQPNPFGCAHARMGFATTFNWIQCSPFDKGFCSKKVNPELSTNAF